MRGRSGKERKNFGLEDEGQLHSTGARAVEKHGLLVLGWKRNTIREWETNTVCVEAELQLHITGARLGEKYGLE